MNRSGKIVILSLMFARAAGVPQLIPRRNQRAPGVVMDPMGI